MYILIPDFKGRVTANNNYGGFLSNLNSMYPRAKVVSVLNGSNTEELAKISRANTCQWLHPIVHENDGRGLVGALMTGYQFLLQEARPSDKIVRLDTTEHDIAYIKILADAARNGCAIGQLNFDKGGLVDGSYDAWIHREVFPTMYGALTNGELKLSCAHGFQAYGLTALNEAFSCAKLILSEVEQKSSQPCSWGFDAMMAIGAIISPCKYKLVSVPAISRSVRNREISQIKAQLENHLQLLMAANRLGLF